MSERIEPGAMARRDKGIGKLLVDRKRGSRDRPGRWQRLLGLFRLWWSGLD